MPWGPSVQQETFFGATQPATNVTITAFTWVGVDFNVTVDGWLYGFRFLDPTRAAMATIGLVWDAFNGWPGWGVKGFFNANSPNADWNQTWIRPRVRMLAGNSYRLGILARGSYKRTANGLSSPVTHGHLKFSASWQTTAIWPPVATITTNANLNAVDLLFGLK